MTKPTDPVAAALDEATPTAKGGVSNIDRLYAERPQVLESVLAARNRGVTQVAIAELLNAGTPDGSPAITEGQVRTWVKNNTPKTPSLQR